VGTAAWRELAHFVKGSEPMLEQMLLQPALAWPEGRFVVAGPSYPVAVQWPANVERIVTDDSHRITQEIEALRAPKN
jgi:hypothetical protein